MSDLEPTAPAAEASSGVAGFLAKALFTVAGLGVLGAGGFGIYKLLEKPDKPATAAATTTPVDCEVSAFTYGPCSATCGGGTRQGTRRITRQPSNGGKPCPALTITEPCNTQPCPEQPTPAPQDDVDDQPVGDEDDQPVGDEDDQPVGDEDDQPVGDEDDQPVGDEDDQPVGDADQPVGDEDDQPVGDEDDQPVFNEPVDCVVSGFTFGPCSAPCGGGEREGTRTVITEPAFGGKPCPELRTKQPCNTEPCKEPCETIENRSTVCQVSQTNERQVEPGTAGVVKISTLTKSGDCSPEQLPTRWEPCRRCKLEFQDVPGASCVPSLEDADAAFLGCVGTREQREVVTIAAEGVPCEEIKTRRVPCVVQNCRPAVRALKVESARLQLRQRLKARRLQATSIKLTSLPRLGRDPVCDNELASKAYVDRVLVSFPVGAVVPFVPPSPSAAVPNNWRVCDGTNGTPDLRGMFVQGAADDANLRAAPGGSVSVSLTVDNMPAHNHTGTTGATDAKVQFSSAAYSSTVTNPAPRCEANAGTVTHQLSLAHGHTIKTAGSGKAIDLNPAHYTVLFIMKVA